MALPKAISESVVTIGHLSIRVYVLENGQRVVNAEDAERFFEALEAGDIKRDHDLDRAVAAVNGEIN